MQVHASCFGEPEIDTGKISYGPTLRVRKVSVLELVAASNPQPDNFAVK
jgi:hypothetical protein